MKGKKRDRKAQVTIFIIIGLILLVTASIVIYMTTLRKVEVIEEVVVPPEVQPIYDYVTNCLYEIGTDGLVRIGSQGGYADLSPERIDTRDITMTPTAYIKIDPSNTFKLPHWFYEGENRIPPIEFIQKELADYVAANLDTCINDFIDFVPQFEIEETGRPVLSSVLTDEDVVVRLVYPIEITQEGKTTEHEDFITHIPIRLKKAWELAKAIMEKENEIHFFENLTIDLISMSPNVPMDDLKFDCTPKIWRLDEVEENVQKLMRYNIPRIRTRGTDMPDFLAPEEVYEELKEYTMKDINEGNFPETPAPADAYEHNRMMIDPGVAGVGDMRVSYVYNPMWGMDLNAFPNQGGLLRSNMAPGQSFMSLLCMNSYHFSYDIIYPVQARIQDTKAYGGNGYIFQFGFPVIIQHNEADREEFGIRQFEDYVIDTGFCEQAGGDTVEIMAVGFDEEGYMMTSGLRGVNISYQCFDQRCNLGQTGYYPQAPGRYVLITSLPPGCAFPIITAEKEGYLPASGQLLDDTLQLEMTKLRKFPVSFVKHPYYETTGIQQGVDFVKGDTVTLYLRLRNSTVQHDQFINYEFGQNETPEIEIVDGDAAYEVNALLYNYDRHVGGYRNTNLTIEYNDFAGYNEAVIHLFEYRPRPIQSEDITAMTMYYMGEDYSESLKPTFR